MMTTVAALVIVFGLMVSLARHVRERAAVALTKDLLRRLDQTMAQYAARHDGRPPVVAAFPPAIDAAATGRGGATGGGRARPNRTNRPPDGTGEATPDREALLAAATANSRDLVAVLKAEPGLAGGALGRLPVSMYDEAVVRDAWGSPIVFMPAMHPSVGTAPQDRFFFFSAGPDRQYLTQDDNLYSYEDAATR